MNGTNAAFYIEGVVNGVSGRHTVIGRCGSAPLRVGEVFTVSYREAQGVPVADQLGVERAEIDPKTVQLRIVEIHAYGQTLDELGEGMTASLALVGSGAEAAEPGRVLAAVMHPAGAPKREPRAGTSSRNDVKATR